jgi:hypothetical protein
MSGIFPPVNSKLGACSTPDTPTEAGRTSFRPLTLPLKTNGVILFTPFWVSGHSTKFKRFNCNKIQLKVQRVGKIYSSSRFWFRIVLGSNTRGPRLLLAELNVTEIELFLLTELPLPNLVSSEFIHRSLIAEKSIWLASVMRR